MNHPAIETVEVTAAHQADELMRQATCCSDGWLDTAKRLNEAPPVVAFGLVELGLVPAEHPGAGASGRRPHNSAHGSGDGMQPTALGRVTAQLREGIAHDAVTPREAAGTQFAPDLHGVAATLGGPCGQVFPVSVQQTGDGGMWCPLRKCRGVHKASHCAMVQPHGAPDRPERLARLVAAHHLLVAGQPTLSTRVAIALSGLERRLIWRSGPHLRV